MKEDETCQHVMVCNKDEICFVQKYFTLGNETRYDFGCTYQELCQKDITGHILGKRNEHAHIACQKCCNDSNICNNDHSCGNIITRQKCLSCDHVDNPKVCNNTMACDKGEVCFLHKYLTETQHVKYDLGCKHSSLCLHGSNTNILGRRTSSGRHLTCERCCDGTELCNTDLQCTHQEQKTINASCRSTNECGSNLVCSSERCKCASRDEFWDNTACITNDCLDNHNDIVKANGKPFTTKDRDNDKYNGNYAVLLKSAWWYSSNYYSDLNKAYNKNSGKMYWAALSGGVSKSIMMIKRIH
ncbi:uncharacterized protein [Mytilus edulis]|uniref:uncharacterized protein isoform X2 n=1 Tax=Mytilus edulis TaxID=6550 RepID=UPI0039F0FCCE